MAEINTNATAGNDALARVLESILVDLQSLQASLGSTYFASTTLDLAALSDGAGTTTTLTVTGATLGDYAQASLSLDISGMTVNAYVSAADTVSVRVQNESGATVDVSSATLRARVSPKAPATLTTTT